jgi:hypothetical protein
MLLMLSPAADAQRPNGVNDEEREALRADDPAVVGCASPRQAGSGTAAFGEAALKSLGDFARFHRRISHRSLRSQVVHAGDWISLAGVVIAAGSAIWAVVSARRAAAAQGRADHYQARAEQHAERATQAAEEAAAAERQSAAHAKRAADALEKQNRMREEQADLAEGVPWQITHQVGDTYDLWNDTHTPKFHVHISGEGVLRKKTVERIDGRSSADFMGLNASGVGDQVVVTWHRREDLSDEPRQWTGNKPPRR